MDKMIPFLVIGIGLGVVVNWALKRREAMTTTTVDPVPPEASPTDLAPQEIGPLPPEATPIGIGFGYYSTRRRS